ncbi:MAG: 50S ribosomal protein L19e [Candidatus Odinarchaeum yellowstonii]|jgi:large subunit ribosomal protein L19e|uniref:Large ribosomal subunit protein eL19 n=1 Tax=Odinarchaeota yellowstonii (strain LCB_4) TaxID=1841599 RepID=A0AAF0D185_ODILC|nr:MAG: 50S ribosomal protein L19e [Candidatus Odinarchaeum yellowstonii]
MSVRPQKELAAKILKVGKSRVWIDPNRIDDVMIAIRRQDIKKLIHEKVIAKKPVTSISRGRVRINIQKKKRGLKVGPGSRKGHKLSTIPDKKLWACRIRKQREYLQQLRDRRLLSTTNYRMLYLRAKGGEFKSLAQLKAFITQNKLLRR